MNVFYVHLLRLFLRVMQRKIELLHYIMSCFLVEHKQELQKKYRGPQYQNIKVKLIKELGELLLQRRAKQDRLTEIVREAGYKDVSKFKKAFEKSCELLEEY